MLKQLSLLGAIFPSHLAHRPAWLAPLRLVATWLGLASCCTSVVVAAEAPRAPRPNIVFILADDLGYGDLGCFGQKRIRTPNIDRLAKEGMRFTQCYAGSTVCAPSRCSLMTGLHTGHGRVRGNGYVPLRPEDRTIAEILGKSGYVTGMFGKWGLGDQGTTGVPNQKGFATWFGFLNQVHAHNHYPDYLWKNQEKFKVEGNVVEKGVASKRSQYAADLFTREALAFLEANKEKPFFLYLPYTLPHANNEAGVKGMEVPSDAPYTSEDWPQAQKNHAAMITYLDTEVGKILKRLHDIKLDENTVVFFSSDNGPHKEGGADPLFFQSAGPLRGWKRDLYEGGIRTPMIVRWPGKIAAGVVSQHLWAFWDFLPTAAELAGEPTPKDLDGLSQVPTFLGVKQGRAQEEHDYLYWEFHERGSQQALRLGNWKYIRSHAAKVPFREELYDLATDLGENKNVAADHADVLAKATALLKEARTESKEWPLRPGK